MVILIGQLKNIYIDTGAGITNRGRAHGFG